MTNSYCQFSFEITKVTQEESEWFDCMDLDEYDTEDTRAYLLIEGGDIGEASQGDDGQMNCRWFYEENTGGMIDMLADVIQAFLEKFRPKEVVTFEWANTCDKPIIGEFGGGAMVISATEIQCLNTGSWASEMKAKLEKTNA